MPGPLDKPVIVVKPVTPNNLPEWTFIYKEGIRQADQACILAKDLPEAFDVAHKVCEIYNWKFVGGLKPRILAGPEILDKVAEPVSR